MVQQHPNASWASGIFRDFHFILSEFLGTEVNFQTKSKRVAKYDCATHLLLCGNDRIPIAIYTLFQNKWLPLQFQRAKGAKIGKIHLFDTPADARHNNDRSTGSYGTAGSDAADACI